MSNIFRERPKSEVNGGILKIDTAATEVASVQPKEVKTEDNYVSTLLNKIYKTPLPDALDKVVYHFEEIFANKRKTDEIDEVIEKILAGKDVNKTDTITADSSLNFVIKQANKERYSWKKDVYVKIAKALIANPTININEKFPKLDHEEEKEKAEAKDGKEAFTEIQESALKERIKNFNSKGFTPLHLATLYDLPEIQTALLEKPDIDKTVTTTGLKYKGLKEFTGEHSSPEVNKEQSDRWQRRVGGFVVKIAAGEVNGKKIPEHEKFMEGKAMTADDITAALKDARTDIKAKEELKASTQKSHQKSKSWFR